MKKLNWNLLSTYRNELFGLSIIGIIVLHYFEDVISYDASHRILFTIAKLYSWLIGSTGVDIFLFLSGMGLYYSMKKNSDIRRFYIHRIKRLLIPYVLLGGVYWIYMDCILEKAGFLQFISDLSLASFWLQGETHFWYVGFIVLCYLCYPILFHASEQEHGRRNAIIITIPAL